MSEQKLSPEELQQFMTMIQEPGTFTSEQLQKVKANIASRMAEKKTDGTITRDKMSPVKEPKLKGIKNAEYEIIEIKDGCNLHKFIEEPLSKRSYEKERFLISRTLIDKIKSRIRFLVVLKSGPKEGDPLIPIALSDKVDISARTLYTVKTSNTLRNALVSLFRKPFSFGFGGKKMLLIGVVVIVGALVVLIYTGYLKIPLKL